MFKKEAKLIQKKLTSSSMVHTPGVFRALQNDYRITGRTRRRAVEILSTGYEITEEEAEGLLSGAIKTEIDESAGTIIYTVPA